MVIDMDTEQLEKQYQDMIDSSLKPKRQLIEEEELERDDVP